MKPCVVVATPLSQGSGVESLRDLGVALVYEPDLLPPPRWLADHAGDPSWRRSTEQDGRWRHVLSQAEVVLGVPGDTPAGYAHLLAQAPRLRWVQAMSAGAGQQLAAAGLAPAALRELVVTTSSGVHAQALAEFAMAGILYFAKDLDRLAVLATQRRWPPRWPMRSVAGQTVLVLGTGEIGRAVARAAAGLQMRTVGVRRRPGQPVEEFGEVHGAGDLVRLASGADALVVTLPGTPGAEGLVSRAVLAALPEQAVVVNVGRGTAIDETALTDALTAGRLRGAALDVFASEPLPIDNPLWQLANVVLSPHTAGLTDDEDRRIVELFRDNLERYLSGRPLRNVVDPQHAY